jgi:hypothetical protein
VGPRSTAGKLIAFAAVLAVLFGVGLAAGSALDPGAPGDEASDEGHETDAMAMGAEDGGAMPVRGLASSAGGLRLVVADAALQRGRTEELSFRILDESGAPIDDFEVEHTKRMHMIVVRRDLSGFQHLHPTMGADGTWTTPLTLDSAGSYRLYADFVREGEPLTLAADLSVDGRADLKALPEPDAVARTDGYEVRLAAGDTHAGEEAALSFEIAKDGEAVDVDPYLGADGHLVVLREGDLAFLHVHPSEHEGDAVEFEATLPTAGRYRMFLQFQHAGEVHTAEFTVEAS